MKQFVRTFNWGNALERGLWTGVQAPAAVGILDGLSADLQVPGAQYLLIALLGIAASVVKTVGQDRLAYLQAKRLNP